MFDETSLKIIINIKKMTNMNVYAYEGVDRYNATVSVVEGNQ